MTPEEKLAEIKRILKSEYEQVWDGKPVTVDTDAYYALEAVLIDTREGKPFDEVCRRTVQDVQMRIGEIMRLLDDKET